MKSKYLPRRPGNDLMHTTKMCETSNSPSSPLGIVTGTAGRSGVVEQGRKLLTWNTGCKRIVAGSFNLEMCFPICSSNEKVQAVYI
jgi:hypothetical protein